MLVAKLCQNTKPNINAEKNQIDNKLKINPDFRIKDMHE